MGDDLGMPEPEEWGEGARVPLAHRQAVAHGTGDALLGCPRSKVTNSKLPLLSAVGIHPADVQGDGPQRRADGRLGQDVPLLQIDHVVPDGAEHEKPDARFLPAPELLLPGGCEAIALAGEERFDGVPGVAGEAVIEEFLHRPVVDLGQV